jgi:hypothetical protein
MPKRSDKVEQVAFLVGFLVVLIGMAAFAVGFNGG